MELTLKNNQKVNVRPFRRDEFVAIQCLNKIDCIQ